MQAHDNLRICKVSVRLALWLVSSIDLKADLTNYKESTTRVEQLWRLVNVFPLKFSA